MTRSACFYSKQKVKNIVKKYSNRVDNSETEHVKMIYSERILWKIGIPVNIEQDMYSTEKWRLSEANYIIYWYSIMFWLFLFSLYLAL